MGNIKRKVLKKDLKLTLDDIENEMIELSKCQETSKIFLCSQRFDMLSKLATFKLKRLEIEKAKEVETKVEPITIQFVNGGDEAQQKRLAEIDKQIGKVGTDA